MKTLKLNLDCKRMKSEIQIIGRAIFKDDIKQLPLRCDFCGLTHKTGDCDPYASCYFCGKDHQSGYYKEFDFISNIE